MRVLDINSQMKKWYPGIDISERPFCYQTFNIPPRESPCSYCPTRLSILDGQRHEAITETPMGGGTSINFRIVSSAIKDETGAVVAAIEVVEDITERVRANRELAESEEKFRAVAESAIDAIVTIDSSGRIIYCNRSLSRLFGYSSAELAGRSMSLLLPDRLQADHAKALGGRPQEAAHGIGGTKVSMGRKKDGTEFPMEISLSSWKSGGKTYFSAMLRDLAERTQAERALRESERKYRSIFESTQDIYFQTDVAGTILEISPSVERHFGFGRAKLIGKSVDVLYADPSAREGLLEALRERGEVQDYELTLKSADDERICTSINAHFMYDSASRPVGLEGSIRNIEDRKRAERAIEYSEAKYRAIFENLQDIFFRTDIEGRILELSPSAEKLTGFRREELIGGPLDGLCESAADRERLFKSIRGNGEVVDHEIQLQDKAGTSIYASVNARILLGPDLVPTGVEGFIRDIRGRKKAETELAVSQMRLASAMDLAHLAHWELDADAGEFVFNDRFYAMLGTTVEIEGGYRMPAETYIRKYVHPEDARFALEGMQRSLLERRNSVFGTQYEHRLIRRDGTIRAMAVNIRIQESPEAQGGAFVYGSIQDITERKQVEERISQSLQEKEVLLKEIHHRVKNNLSVISSLLSLQSQYIKDKEAQGLFEESRNRAKSMALIHERLYQSTDQKRIDFGEYIRTLSLDLFNTYVDDPTRIKLKVSAESLMVDINTTVPLGLILNELVTNALKHAFADGRAGEIRVEFRRESGVFHVASPPTRAWDSPNR